MHLGSLQSTREARVALGYRLEQLLRFPRALQTKKLFFVSKSKVGPTEDKTNTK